MNFCPNCGKELKPEQQFCGGCGKPIGDIKPVFSAQTHTNLKVKPCPACNKEVGMTATKCPHCGTSLRKSVDKLLIEIWNKLLVPVVVISPFYYFYTVIVSALTENHNYGIKGDSRSILFGLGVIFLGYGLSLLSIPKIRNLFKPDEDRSIHKAYAGIISIILLYQFITLLQF